ncbi:MAG: SDR family oxidoreductase [Actinobacteria bacterium]|nr:SDR family oxidoreductase [Actinomycetota bacterium]
MDSSQNTGRFSLEMGRILVTGASRGLGRGIALAATEAGADVIGIARSESGLHETKTLTEGMNGGFEAMDADLTDEAGLDRLVRQAWEGGPITGIVHAAGVQARRPAVDITRDDWRRVAAIHTEAPFFLSTSVARLQQDSGVTGSHVFIGSLTSWIGLPNIAPYAAGKSGILGLTRTLAVEWAELGIRVNAVCPGYFHTALTDEVLSDPDRRSQLLARIPMRRFGIAEDLAGAVIFFLSAASDYVTGQVINVDGGWLAG